MVKLYQIKYSLFLCVISTYGDNFGYVLIYGGPYFIYNQFKCYFTFLKTLSSDTVKKISGYVVKLENIFVKIKHTIVMTNE